MAARWLREPLVHFVAIGALLFVVFEWRGAGAASRRIVITPGQVEAMAAGFARTWQREATEDELKGLIDEWVRDEIAAREALAAGLDRDDTVIRRRLRQKWEFAAEDAAVAAPPADAELQAWLDAHADAFRAEPLVTFMHTMDGGMPQMLPAAIERATRSDVARMFGDEFAAALMRAETGRWAGPITSGYGRHQVLIAERIESRVPPLDQVRAQVERAVIEERRRRHLQHTYEGLLGRYQVVVERRGTSPASR